MFTIFLIVYAIVFIIICFSKKSIQDVWAFYLILGFSFVLAIIFGGFSEKLLLIVIPAVIGIPFSIKTIKETKTIYGKNLPYKTFFISGREDSPFKRALTHLMLILCCIITVYPLTRIFTVSVMGSPLSTDLSILPPGYDFSAYEKVIAGSGFLTWLWNSIIITLFTSAIGIILASSAAYALSRFRKFPGRRAGLGFLLGTQMIPAGMLILPIYMMLIKLGLTNNLLGVLIAYSMSALPFTISTLKGFFDTIPISIEESAMVDGTGWIGAFYRIVLPLSTPALAIAFLFNFTTAWNEYLIANVILKDPNLYTWTLGIVSFQGARETAWGPFAAASLLVTIPVLIVFLYSAKYMISGMTLGGVKD